MVNEFLSTRRTRYLESNGRLKYCLLRTAHGLFIASDTRSIFLNLSKAWMHHSTISKCSDRLVLFFSKLLHRNILPFISKMSRDDGSVVSPSK